MSLFTIRSGANAHPEETFLFFMSATVKRGGVEDITDGDLEVQENSGGADLSVDVQPGLAFLRKDSTSVYPVRATSVTDVSISSNSSGNPRIDSIVIYADLAATPANDGTGVITITSVNGTAATSPSAPSTSDIETAIGASNPYEVLANIDVSSGASAINTADITDTRRRFFLNSATSINTITFSSSISVDMRLSRYHEVTLTGDITVSSFDNMQSGEWVILKIIQDGTGGHSVTFTPTTNSKSPDLSLADGANQETIYSLQKQEDGSFDYYLVGKDY